ncbi:MAG: PIN domain-containing protein [Defluviitaleaceae bacterium]|nr:PIN domain-containing protein [Defluviitaleaceae bacterium]
MKCKIYLDNCCFNRPYDDQTQLKIELEKRAKLRIQEMIVAGRLELVASYILEFENDDNPYAERRFVIENFLKYATLNMDESDEVLNIANAVKDRGLKTKDALHVACAIIAKCDYLITTDARFLKFTDSRIRIISPIEFIIETEES